MEQQGQERVAFFQGRSSGEEMPSIMVRKDQPLLIDLSSIADQRMQMREGAVRRVAGGDKP